MLMALKILVTFINGRRLEETIVNEIIGFYYPEFKKFKLKKNLKGRITEI
jgi:hypothetical protein